MLASAAVTMVRSSNSMNMAVQTSTSVHAGRTRMTAACSEPGAAAGDRVAALFIVISAMLGYGCCVIKVYTCSATLVNEFTVGGIPDKMGEDEEHGSRGRD